MGWTICLEDERKKTIFKLDFEFELEVISDASKTAEFKLIKYLDPYGDAVFNQLQMDDLISDLKKLGGINNSEDIQKIIALAVKCKLEPHTYLAFYGD